MAEAIMGGVIANDFVKPEDIIISRRDVSKLEANEVITLINCRYNDQLIEKAILTSDGTEVTISQSSAMKVNTEKLVVLNMNSNG